jgi:hypothetical protein
MIKGVLSAQYEVTPKNSLPVAKGEIKNPESNSKAAAGKTL